MASGGSSQTSTTKLPAWMEAAGQETYNAAKASNAANPIKPYTGPLGPTAAPNVGAAAEQAKKAVGTGQSQVTAGTGMATAAGNATSDRMSAGQDWTAAGMASKYMDPYVAQVQQNTLREMQRQGEINQNAVNDAAGAAKSFGGDRHGIVAAEQMKNDAQARTDYIDRSNQAAYDAGRTQFNTDRGFNADASKFNAAQSAGDLDRKLAGAGVLGQLGNTAAGIASSDVQRLLGTGMAQTDISAAQNDAAYQEFVRQQNAPMDRYAQMAGIISGVPHSSSTTTKQPGSIMNTIMGGAMLGASIFSDERLKDEIVATGDEWHGLPVFEFGYRKDTGLELPEGRFRGVMAQDAFVEYPDAVSVGSNGYLQIDYDQIARSNIE